MLSLTRTNPKRSIFLTVSLSVFLLFACNGEGQSASSGNNTNTSTGTDTSGSNTPSNGNTILLNATVYTVDDQKPSAQAVAYNDKGVIIAVGTESDVRTAAGEGAAEKDLQGAFVMPGFQDLHVHAVEAGINANRCIVPAFGSRQQYKSAVTKCAQTQAGNAWVFAAGVSVADLFDVAESPIAFLDELVPDRPALVLDNVGHGAWANTKAMQAVGYMNLTGNPQGGIIDRFEDGSPNGIVFENAQQELRTAAFPPTTANLNENYQGLLSGLQTLAKNGITTVGDAGGYWTRGHEEAWKRAETDGKLTVRASNTLYVFPDHDFDTQVAEIKQRKTADANKLVQFNQVKIYIDGILSLGTGALYDPYTKEPGVVVDQPSGFEYFERQQLVDYAAELDAAGFQLHFHATGDRGVGLALDAVEEVRRLNGAGKAHRITHCYLVDEEDHARFQDLNVVADFQISPNTAGSQYREFIREFIGGRADRLFPIPALLKAGADVILTSDWDADDVSPLVKLEIAVTRDRDAVPDLKTAVEMLTILPAKVIGQDAQTGSLEVGKLADIVVLDQDIFKVDPSKIDETKVLGTLLGGTVTYDRSGLLK